MGDEPGSGDELGLGNEPGSGDELGSVLEPSTGVKSGCLIELAIRPFSEVYTGPQKLRRTSKVAQDLGSYARPLKLRRTLEGLQDLRSYAGPQKLRRTSEVTQDLRSPASLLRSCVTSEVLRISSFSFHPLRGLRNAKWLFVPLVSLQLPGLNGLNECHNKLSELDRVSVSIFQFLFLVGSGAGTGHWAGVRLFNRARH